MNSYGNYNIDIDAHRHLHDVAETYIPENMADSVDCHRLCIFHSFFLALCHSAEQKRDKRVVKQSETHARHLASTDS